MKIFTREIAIGLDAMQYLYGFNERQSSERIAEAIHESHDYTVRALARLRLLGFVSAHKGPTGGYVLSPMAEHSSLGGFLRAYKGDEYVRTLVPGRASDNAFAVVEDALDGITLLQLFGGDERNGSQLIFEEILK